MQAVGLQRRPFPRAVTPGAQCFYVRTGRSIVACPSAEPATGSPSRVGFRCGAGLLGQPGDVLRVVAVASGLGWLDVPVEGPPGPVPAKHHEEDTDGHHDAGNRSDEDDQSDTQAGADETRSEQRINSGAGVSHGSPTFPVPCSVTGRRATQASRLRFVTSAARTSHDKNHRQEANGCNASPADTPANIRSAHPAGQSRSAHRRLGV